MVQAAAIKEMAAAIVRAANDTFVEPKAEVERMAEELNEMAFCRSRSEDGLEASADVMLLTRLADMLTCTAVIK